MGIELFDNDERILLNHLTAGVGTNRLEKNLLFLL